MNVLDSRILFPEQTVPCLSEGSDGEPVRAALTQPKSPAIIIICAKEFSTDQLNGTKAVTRNGQIVTVKTA